MKGRGYKGGDKDGGMDKSKGWMWGATRVPLGCWRCSALLCPWGTDIKALHINTITKEEDKKEKRGDMKR